MNKKERLQREIDNLQAELDKERRETRHLMDLMFRVRNACFSHVGDKIGITFEGWADHAERLLKEKP